MNAQEVERAIAELTDAILARHAELNELVIVGIRMAGAFIAHRIAERIRVLRGAAVDLGVLDVQGGGDTIPRWPGDARRPTRRASPIADRHVVVVDDVINTGWTVKDALAAVWRAGRPLSARLAVLIDRGHRQLPLKPTYVGKHLPTAPHERVRVRLRELDREHRDRVVIYSYVDPKARGVIDLVITRRSRARSGARSRSRRARAGRRRPHRRRRPADDDRAAGARHDRRARASG